MTSFGDFAPAPRWSSWWTSARSTRPASSRWRRCGRVSLRIDENEFVAIIGPSGSGKSTLMHILGCLDVPTSGMFRLAGHDVRTFDENTLADVRNLFIGFVFQQFNLLAYLPAWRNVELPLVYAGVDAAERRERALAALEQVGLADRAEHRPGRAVGRPAAAGRGRTRAR